MSFQILQRAYAPYGTAAQFPASGDSRLIYRATDTGYLYTWDASESAYKLASISPDHTHNYAGSSAPGGAATSALECTGNAATATTAASCTGNSATATTASSCSGNAATATTLATARTLTIGSTGKTFNGSANVAWTLAEIGAVSQEVGTWTPSFTAVTEPTGVTYSTRVGKYIKTGVDCTVEVIIVMTSKGSGGSGHAIFSGLTFKSYNSTYSIQWKGPVGFIFNLTTPDDTFKLAWGVRDNQTSCYLGRNGGNYYIEQWSDLTDTTTVYGSFNYRTAA